MMLITDEELNMLEACNTEEQWNAACDRIKGARGGTYPEDWFFKVLVSGMVGRITARFPRR